MILFALVLLGYGAFAALSPRSIWYLSEGWKFRDAQPSDLAMVLYRLSGVLAVVVAIGIFLGGLGGGPASAGGSNSAGGVEAFSLPTATTAPTAISAAQSTPTAADPVIIYQRSGGFAAKTVERTVYPDGRVVAADGTEQKVPATKVSDLVAQLEEEGFFKLEHTYGMDSQCRDCYQYDITVRSGDMLKQVQAVGEAQEIPDSAREMIGQIEALLDHPA
ncbi:MAG: hypothetical protein M0Z94_04575 [Dehalococcoidales bacterium]|nr:hypothetical protein [Dehalococcoidales bacterium]